MQTHLQTGSAVLLMLEGFLVSHSLHRNKFDSAKKPISMVGYTSNLCHIFAKAGAEVYELNNSHTMPSRASLEVPVYSQGKLTTKTSTNSQHDDTKVADYMSPACAT